MPRSFPKQLIACLIALGLLILGIALIAAASTVFPQHHKTQNSLPNCTTNDCRLNEASLDSCKSHQNTTKMNRSKYQDRQVHAVALGLPVSYSSCLGHEQTHYHIDYTANTANSWTAQTSKLGEWIQVYSQTPRQWVGLIIQGRGDEDQWVKKIKVFTSVDGQVWESVEEGKVFEGSNDRSTKVRVQFRSPVWGNTLRIYPQQWHNRISMRFEAIYRTDK